MGSWTCDLTSVKTACNFAADYCHKAGIQNKAENAHWKMKLIRKNLFELTESYNSAYTSESHLQSSNDFNIAVPFLTSRRPWWANVIVMRLIELSGPRRFSKWNLCARKSKSAIGQHIMRRSIIQSHISDRISHEWFHLNGSWYFRRSKMDFKTRRSNWVEVKMCINVLRA